MTHGSLFSGIGGFDLAAEWMGWENVFHCEINPFGRKVLNHYWPQSISYEDITKTDFSIHRGTIDVLTGGFPCQPYSVAGERKGKEDERHLWPEMLREIREIAPKWVVGENVYGIINWNDGLVFEEVQTDLENQGYKVQPILLPACSQDAEHQRYRIWFIAYSISQGLEGFNPEWQNIRMHKRSAPAIISYRDVLERSDRSRHDSQHIRSSNGIPTRLHKDSIQALGNAIVPQVVFQIFKVIEQLTPLPNKEERRNNEKY